MHKSKISEEQEIDIAVQRMIESINDVLQRTERAAHRAQLPKLFNLRSACEYKGESYDAVKKTNWRQPLCGYYTHWEETPRRIKPRWTREQIEEWACITAPQRRDYIEALLYNNDAEVAKYVQHNLNKDRTKEVLPDHLIDIIDSYNKMTEGQAV